MLRYRYGVWIIVITNELYSMKTIAAVVVIALLSLSAILDSVQAMNTVHRTFRLSTQLQLHRMSSTGATPVATAITSKLTAAFSPSHLQVMNESYMHNV